MLKEVGASGQISLGKKHAGRLFELVSHPDGRLELIPMTVVSGYGMPPPSAGLPLRDGGAPAHWRPPGGYGAANAWSLQNRAALEGYAAEIEQEGTAAEQLQQFLDEQAEAAGGPAPQSSRIRHGPV